MQTVYVTFLNRASPLYFAASSDESTEKSSVLMIGQTVNGVMTAIVIAAVVTLLIIMLCRRCGMCRAAFAYIFYNICFCNYFFTCFGQFPFKYFEI